MTMTPSTSTIQGFADRYSVTCEATLTDRNPNMEDWTPGVCHWLVTLRRPGALDDMTLHYSTGPAIEREPSIEDVLGCLHSDATYRDYGIDEFCEELEAKPSTYLVLQDQMKELESFLFDCWDEFLECEPE